MSLPSWSVILAANLTLADGNLLGLVLPQRYSMIRKWRRFDGVYSLEPRGETVVGALTLRVRDRNARLQPGRRGFDHRAPPNSRIRSYCRALALFILDRYR